MKKDMSVGRVSHGVRLSSENLLVIGGSAFVAIAVHDVPVSMFQLEVEVLTPVVNVTYRAEADRRLKLFFFCLCAVRLYWEVSALVI